jgi:general L-amino acid transport system substrate-binding protein
MLRVICAATASLFVLATGSTAHATGTLEAIKQRGVLKCGVAGNAPGFSAPDSSGRMAGLDADICRAVAAAVFGDAERVEFVETTTRNRFEILASGAIDLLSRTATKTFTRDTGLGIAFGPPVFYDGQGFMVTEAANASRVSDLSGTRICVSPNSTSETNLAEYFRDKGLAFQPVVIETLDGVREAFFSGQCDAMTDDRSTLASNRSLASNPSAYVILPDTISKEPLAPAVREGDDQWRRIVTWVVYTLIAAEELGITQANVEQKRQSGTADVQFLLGEKPDSAGGLGLGPRWAYNVILEVGNYGEIYDRWIGEQSALKLPRHLNELWFNWGLMYAPPMR